MEKKSKPIHDKSEVIAGYMAQVQACDCRKAKEKAALLYVCRQQPFVSQASICCVAVKGRLHTTTLSGCGCDSDPLLTTTRIFFIYT